MSAPEERWWSARAGEYVLGTLRGEDLDLFEKILVSDTAMQATVARWERRLSSLNETTPQLVPGEHVLPEILERIRQLDESDVLTRESDVAVPGGQPLISAVDTSDMGAGSQVAATRESSFWPNVAGIATTVSLILAALMFHNTTLPQVRPLNVDGVAVVLSDDTGTPYFLVETDYGNLRVRVTALAPPGLDDTRDFQLWQALPDRSAVKPVALLPEDAGSVKTFTVDSLINGSDLFGVSIEPVGATTNGGPTGPVVAHGDFLPTHNLD